MAQAGATNAAARAAAAPAAAAGALRLQLHDASAQPTASGSTSTKQSDPTRPAEPARAERAVPGPRSLMYDAAAASRAVRKKHPKWGDCGSALDNIFSLFDGYPDSYLAPTLLPVSGGPAVASATDQPWLPKGTSPTHAPPTSKMFGAKPGAPQTPMAWYSDLGSWKTPAKEDSDTRMSVLKTETCGVGAFGRDDAGTASCVFGTKKEVRSRCKTRHARLRISKFGRLILKLREQGQGAIVLPRIYSAQELHKARPRYVRVGGYGFAPPARGRGGSTPRAGELTAVRRFSADAAREAQKNRRKTRQEAKTEAAKRRGSGKSGRGQSGRSSSAAAAKKSSRGDRDRDKKSKKRGTRTRDRDRERRKRDTASRKRAISAEVLTSTRGKSLKRKADELDAEGKPKSVSPKRHKADKDVKKDRKRDRDRDRERNRDRTRGKSARAASAGGDRKDRKPAGRSPHGRDRDRRSKKDDKEKDKKGTRDRDRTRGKDADKKKEKKGRDGDKKRDARSKRRKTPPGEKAPTAEAATTGGALRTRAGSWRSTLSRRSESEAHVPAGLHSDVSDDESDFEFGDGYV